MSKLVKLERYEKNPILLPRPYTAWDTIGAFNPGAAIDDAGRIHILYRGAGVTPKNPGSKFHVATIGHAITDDGFNIVERSDFPAIDLLGEDHEIWGITGVEDPRITKIDDTYYIVYCITSHCWDRLALASTKDFKTYKKHGLIVKDMSQRTGGLFPEKINGNYFLMHRPIPNIWISQSPDLKEWGDAKMIMTNQVLPWCNEKLGICAPPFRTEKAWAVIFHGKDRHCVYRLGIFWLDLEDPYKVLKIQEQPILEPEAPYETQNGITGNCIYACGAVVKDGKVFVYYGAGDSVGCVATMPQEMLELPNEL
jgi:beta-1,2-mannobiose phosphorylase / 1,2-beta-oligomannan phosphorylase